MKKALTLITLLMLCSAAVPPVANAVFICKSTTSKRYHLKKTCRGLSACKAEVGEITLKKAKYMGRTLCKWED